LLNNPLPPPLPPPLLPAGPPRYNPAHPWRPHRSTLVHSLVSGYDLNDKMMIHRPTARTYDQLTQFHADGAPLLWLGWVGA